MLVVIIIGMKSMNTDWDHLQTQIRANDCHLTRMCHHHLESITGSRIVITERRVHPSFVGERSEREGVTGRARQRGFAFKTNLCYLLRGNLIYAGPEPGPG